MPLPREDATGLMIHAPLSLLNEPEIRMRTERESVIKDQQRSKHIFLIDGVYVNSQTLSECWLDRGVPTHCWIPGTRQEAQRSGVRCGSFESHGFAASSGCFCRAGLSVWARTTWKATGALTVSAEDEVSIWDSEGNINPWNNTTVAAHVRFDLLRRFFQTKCTRLKLPMNTCHPPTWKAGGVDVVVAEWKCVWL